MKRRAFSQIMAIITVSVLVLLAIIIMAIVFYIQKTNMLVEYASKQVVYTISLSQHVDSAIESFFEFNTFKQVDKVNDALNLDGKTMLRTPDGEYYMYYQPLYKDYLSGSNYSYPEYDVRWLWVHNYLTDSQRVFPYMQSYVENMNIPSYIRNQTFRFEREIPFYSMVSSSIVNTDSNLYKMVPDFYIDENLLFLITQKGFEVVTSNYTVEVVSKASVDKSESGGSDVYFEKGGTYPFMITRDIHAGEFLIDFRVIQMYNALLFEHLRYQQKVKDWVNTYAYVYIIPNDDENPNQIYLYSQLIDNIPQRTSEWHPIDVGALSKYTVVDSKTVVSSMVGKYGYPINIGTEYKSIPNFEWMIYNIVFTPPYTIHPDVDYSSIEMRQYIPFTLYTPITKHDDELYVGNTQWIMLKQSIIKLLMDSTNYNNFGADALYALVDIIAHIKEGVLRDGTAPSIQVKSLDGEVIQEFRFKNGEAYAFAVKSTDSVSKYSSIIKEEISSIPYTGIVWLSVVDNERELDNYLKDGQTNEKYGKFTLYNLFFNTYMLGHYNKMIEQIDNQNSPNSYSDYLIQKLTDNIYFDYRAIPYPTLISMRNDAHENFLYQVIGINDFKSPNLLSYKDSINFIQANIMKKELYENPNLHWSYIRWTIAGLQPPRLALIMSDTYKNSETFYYVKDGKIYPITPTTVVYNNPMIDFPDAIQLWWIPTTDKINNIDNEALTDKYDWETSLTLNSDMIVKISDSQTATLKDLVGNTVQLGGAEHTQEEIEAVRNMYENISVSRPVITDIQYKVDNIKIHFYYAPQSISARIDRYSFSQEITHTYNCHVIGDCCISWEYNETSGQDVCVEWGNNYGPDGYGTHSKDSYIEYLFSIFMNTKDRYNLHIFKDFNTGYQKILGLSFLDDINYWKKIRVKTLSEKQYFTPYFFITSWTSHTNWCGCEDSYGEFRYGVNYKKVILQREELYYVIEVAEIDLRLRITYDLYATDLNFINNYLGLWKQGNIHTPYYNVLYVMDKDGITHLSLIGDTSSILSSDGSGYPTYYEIFNDKISERYIDPNFLIGKKLYVKSKFMIEVPVKIYIITRYWYGTPGRLNVPQMQTYLTQEMFSEPTKLSSDSFDITYYINNINNYRAEALRLLPYYYLNPMVLPSYGLPFMIAPDRSIVNHPFGIPPEVQTTYRAYIGDFKPRIFG